MSYYFPLIPSLLAILYINKRRKADAILKQLIHSPKKVLYFNAKEDFSAKQFGEAFRKLLEENLESNQTLVFLCIGSDRATGDCLGPILGDRLSKLSLNRYQVYGTLENPVHAKNLSDTIEYIYKKYSNPFIVAVDSSLGQASHVGYVTLGKGTLKPGAGVDKELPAVGDLFITGIVNFSGMFDQMLLQTTRLHLVMSLANNIYYGIQKGILI